MFSTIPRILNDLIVSILSKMIICPSQVCWFDSQYKVSNLKSDKERSVDNLTVDILTKLERKTFTRHLARKILGYMKEEDLVIMVTVSRNWRIFLMRELRPRIFCKIRHLQIVESNRKKY